MINIFIIVPETASLCFDWFPDYCRVAVQNNSTGFQNKFCGIFGLKICRLSCDNCGKFLIVVKVLL